MKKKTLTILTLMSVFFFWGCFPKGAEFTEDLDIVVCYHNDEYDFGAKSTYALPDKIVKITGNLLEGDEPEFIPDIYADQILARIESNMATLGWTKVGVDEDPDLLLAPAAWETTTVYYYYDYWYWWWGGYYPYWGYPPTYVSSYTTGTLMMTLLDPDQINTNGNPVIQWTGAINGLLTGTYDADRVLGGVDQAFKQSPYLKTN